MLLNIDKPLKRATFHNDFCSFVTKPQGTKLKPLGRMGDDGGWLAVKSEPEAIILARSDLPEVVSALLTSPHGARASGQDSCRPEHSG